MPKFIVNFEIWLLDYGDRLYRYLAYKRMLAPYEHIMPAIQKWLNVLRAHPEKYKQYEAENGWGTVSGTARFFAQILKDWEEYTRWEDPEVIAKTTFWVD